MIPKSIVCLLKGHDINPEESIVSFIDKRNWLCKCHRCRLYEAHEGVISNSSFTVEEKTAIEMKKEFEALMARFEERHAGLSGEA